MIDLIDTLAIMCALFFFSSRRRHTRCLSDWSSDVCSSDLFLPAGDRDRARAEKRPMNKRSTLSGGTLLALALLFIGLTMLFNHALRGWRLDLTQHRLYTTAAGTDRILASIREPINLYFFFSEKAAAQLPQLKTYGVRVREFLEELAARSGGRLHLHVIDPQPFSEEEDRASELGVRGTPVGTAGTQFYFGLAGTNSTDGRAAIEFFDPNKEQFLQ